MCAVNQLLAIFSILWPEKRGGEKRQIKIPNCLIELEINSKILYGVKFCRFLDRSFLGNPLFLYHFSLASFSIQTSIVLQEPIWYSRKFIFVFKKCVAVCHLCMHCIRAIVLHWFKLHLMYPNKEQWMIETLFSMVLEIFWVSTRVSLQIL